MIGDKIDIKDTDDVADVEQGVKSSNKSVPDGAEGTARKSYWVYGRTTFRAFFHRLAWTSNYSLVAKLWGPIVAWLLLTSEGFGGGNLTSTLIILLSLQDLAQLSSTLLDYLVKMSRGSSVLRDVAELLNCDVEDSNVAPSGPGISNELLNELKSQEDSVYSRTFRKVMTEFCSKKTVHRFCRIF
jgi:hypothetical protein